MSVSVIIPTLDEENCLAETLHNVRRHKPHEIIVADGGSRDRTREIAAQADWFVQAPRGRARQMNEGAKRASGDVVLFLHADCLLEDGALTAAEGCLRRRGVAAQVTLGVPYTADEVTGAAELARQQGRQIAQSIVEQGGPRGLDESRLVALIAYLQRLGTDIKKTTATAGTDGRRAEAEPAGRR